MKYMVIESFRQDKKAVYERYNSKGRMLPEGLKYIDSWLATDGKRCFQLMETDQPELLAIWTAEWDDLVDFEIVAVESPPAEE